MKSKAAIASLDKANAAGDQRRLSPALQEGLPRRIIPLFAAGALIALMLGIALHAGSLASPVDRLDAALTKIEDRLAGMLALPEGAAVPQQAIDDLSTGIGALATTALGQPADPCRDRMAGYAIHAGDELVTHLAAHRGVPGPEFHGNARQFLEQSRGRLEACRGQ